MENRITPTEIHELKENEIFVFASNEGGLFFGENVSHLNAIKFGAQRGYWHGRYGDTYAIPTKDWKFDVLPADLIQKEVDKFIVYAKENPELTFLVYEMNYRLKGHTPKEIAPLFTNALEVNNIFLPKEFWDVLNAVADIKFDRYVIEMDPYEHMMDGHNLNHLTRWRPTTSRASEIYLNKKNEIAGEIVPSQSIDYETLLIKYIEHVNQSEGLRYVNFKSDVEFTQEEMKALRDAAYSYNTLQAQQNNQKKMSKNYYKVEYTCDCGKIYGDCGEKGAFLLVSHPSTYKIFHKGCSQEKMESILCGGYSKINALTRLLTHGNKVSLSSLTEQEQKDIKDL